MKLQLLTTISGEMETELVIKTEIDPGAIIAETSTVVGQGTCLTITVTTGKIKIGLPTLKLGNKCRSNKNRH